MSHQNRYIAGYFSNPIDFQDLIQLGNVGLLHAIKLYKYDHSAGASFNTYALYRVRQKINYDINYRMSLIHIPGPKRGKILRSISSLDAMEDWQQPGVCDREQLESHFEFTNILESALNKNHFYFEMLCHKYGILGREKLFSN